MIKQVGSNMTELTNGKFVILFSYNTPVAAINTDTKQVYRTNHFFSKTTSTHINKWFKMITNNHIAGLVAFNPHMVSQTELESMTM